MTEILLQSAEVIMKHMYGDDKHLLQLIKPVGDIVKYLIW